MNSEEETVQWCIVFLCGKQNRPPWGWRSSGKRQCRL